MSPAGKVAVSGDDDKVEPSLLRGVMPGRLPIIGELTDGDGELEPGRLLVRFGLDERAPARPERAVRNAEGVVEPAAAATAATASGLLDDRSPELPRGEPGPPLLLVLGEPGPSCELGRVVGGKAGGGPRSALLLVATAVGAVASGEAEPTIVWEGRERIVSPLAEAAGLKGGCCRLMRSLGILRVTRALESPRISDETLLLLEILAVPPSAARGSSSSERSISSWSVEKMRESSRIKALISRTSRKGNLIPSSLRRTSALKHFSCSCSFR